uniref:Voltage-dependent calcium channel alpha-1 subunit IQ domain-containing protein n=1 Tax=Timema tahoe TaxID=61484 RepID=A0A7R9IEF4_9NEOP|nr:unnamed protein product [Timema tahoe]
MVVIVVLVELKAGKLTVGKIYAALLILENWRNTRFGQVEPSGQQEKYATANIFRSECSLLTRWARPTLNYLKQVMKVTMKGLKELLVSNIDRILIQGFAGHSPSHEAVSSLLTRMHVLLGFTSASACKESDLITGKRVSE